MAIVLNHTIVPAKDKIASGEFLRRNLRLKAQAGPRLFCASGEAVICGPTRSVQAKICMSDVLGARERESVRCSPNYRKEPVRSRDIWILGIQSLGVLARGVEYHVSS